jgi:hypothetical protein
LNRTVRCAPITNTSPGFGTTRAEWNDVLRDLDALSETEVVSEDGRRFRIRSESRGRCGKAFQAVGVAMPPSCRAVSS